MNEFPCAFVVELSSFSLSFPSATLDNPDEIDDKLLTAPKTKGLGTVSPSSFLTAFPPSRTMSVLPSVVLGITRFLGDLSFLLVRATISIIGGLRAEGGEEGGSRALKVRDDDEEEAIVEGPSSLALDSEGGGGDVK